VNEEKKEKKVSFPSQQVIDISSMGLYTHIERERERETILHFPTESPISSNVPSQRELPVIDLIPPPAYPDSKSVATDTGGLVPMPPADEGERPQRALNEREQKLYIIY
jgi:hypothetical protein